MARWVEEQRSEQSAVYRMQLPDGEAERHDVWARDEKGRPVLRMTTHFIRNTNQTTS